MVGAGGQGWQPCPLFYPPRALSKQAPPGATARGALLIVLLLLLAA